MIVITKIREIFLSNQGSNGLKKAMVRPYLVSFLKIGKDFFSKYGKSFSIALSTSLTLASLLLFTACAGAGGEEGNALSSLTLEIGGTEYAVNFDKERNAEISATMSRNAPPDTAVVSNLKLTEGATVKDSSDKIVTDGDTLPMSASGDNRKVEINVTDKDGTTRTYTITVLFINSDALISELTLSLNGNDYPVIFDENKQATVNGLSRINANPDAVTIKTLSASKGATVTDSDSNALANESSATIVTGTDSHTVTLSVTAEDSSTSEYTITLDYILPIILSGHDDNVRSIVFSPDGSRLVSGSYDDTIKIWDASVTANSSTPIATLSGHDDDVNSVAFHPDGSRIASGSNDDTIKIWDATVTANTSTPIATLSEHTRDVNSVAFSPNGSRLASSSFDSTVKIWDASKLDDATPTAPLIASLSGHIGRVNSVAFRPDGSKLASTSNDNTIKIWDATVEANTSTPITTLSGHLGGAKFATFHPDGSKLASSSNDNTIKIWDIRHLSKYGMPAS